MSSAAAKQVGNTVAGTGRPTSPKDLLRCITKKMSSKYQDSLLIKKDQYKQLIKNTSYTDHLTKDIRVFPPSTTLINHNFSTESVYIQLDPDELSPL
jgi:hypothetical protein